MSVPHYEPVSDATVTICGVSTRVSCLRFHNRVVLTVTQTPGFGAMASVPSAALAAARAPRRHRV